MIQRNIPSIHFFLLLLILHSGCRGWWRLSQLFVGEVGLHPGNPSLWGQRCETNSHSDSHLYIRVASYPDTQALRLWEETRIPQIITKA